MSVCCPRESAELCAHRAQMSVGTFLATHAVDMPIGISTQKKRVRFGSKAAGRFGSDAVISLRLLPSTAKVSFPASTRGIMEQAGTPSIAAIAS